MLTPRVTYIGPAHHRAAPTYAQQAASHLAAAAELDEQARDEHSEYVAAVIVQDTRAAKRAATAEQRTAERAATERMAAKRAAWRDRAARGHSASVTELQRISAAIAD